MNDERNIEKDKGNEVLQYINDSLTIKQVAAKYGEKVECMFYDYDNEWKKKKMVVNAAFLKDMEHGAIKDCH